MLKIHVFIACAIAIILTMIANLVVLGTNLANINENISGVNQSGNKIQKTLTQIEQRLYDLNQDQKKQNFELITSLNLLVEQFMCLCPIHGIQTKSIKINS